MASGPDLSMLPRQMEKAALLREIHALETKMASLKRKLRPHDCALLETQMRHRSLSRALQSGVLAAAALQSLYAEFLTTRLQSPAQSYIHLTADVAQRRATLSSLKSQKLLHAKRFLDHRFRHVDPQRMLSETQEFESLEGGYCSITCDAIRFENAKSLKHVFDSVMFNLTSFEMAVSENLGAVAVRIDDDDNMAGIAQARIVAALPSGVRVDGNFVLFSQYYEDEGDGESAVYAVDFVDRDDLYPFHPEQCVRKDPTAFCRMICMPRKNESEALVVVKQRWMTIHLRKPQFEVPAQAWEELKGDMDPWTETIQRNVVAGVQSAQTSKS